MQHTVFVETCRDSRQLLLYPTGNTRAGSHVVSLYVKCVLPQACPAATFTLLVVNNDHGKTVKKGVPAQLHLQVVPKPDIQSEQCVACSEAGHVFNPQAHDWGHLNFATQDVLYAPDAGFLSSDGRLTITLMLHVSRWARLSLHEVCYLVLAQSTFTLRHALPLSTTAMIRE